MIASFDPPTTRSGPATADRRRSSCRRSRPTTSSRCAAAADQVQHLGAADRAGRTGGAITELTAILEDVDQLRALSATSWPKRSAARDPGAQSLLAASGVAATAASVPARGRRQPCWVLLSSVGLLPAPTMRIRSYRRTAGKPRRGGVEDHRDSARRVWAGHERGSPGQDQRADLPTVPATANAPNLQGAPTSAS